MLQIGLYPNTKLHNALNAIDMGIEQRHAIHTSLAVANVVKITLRKNAFLIQKHSAVYYAKAPTPPGAMNAHDDKRKLID